MIYVAMDIETTGLDLEKDEITEIAWVVKEWGNPKPFEMRSFFVGVDGEISEEITKLTGITKRHTECGFSAEAVYLALVSAGYIYGRYDYVMAHNGRQFDIPFMLKYGERVGVSEKYLDTIRNWKLLDTKADIEWDKQGVRYNNLTYLAAHHGFLNPFPHAALFDVMTMIRVAETQDLDILIKRAASPDIIISPEFPFPFERKDEAKSRGFRWQEVDYQQFDKRWVKKIKEMDLEKIASECPFKVEVIHRV